MFFFYTFCRTNVLWWQCDSVTVSPALSPLTGCCFWRCEQWTGRHCSLLVTLSRINWPKSSHTIAASRQAFYVKKNNAFVICATRPPYPPCPSQLPGIDGLPLLFQSLKCITSVYLLHTDREEEEETQVYVYVIGNTPDYNTYFWLIASTDQPGL